MAAIALTLAWLGLAASPAGAEYVFERQWGSEGTADGEFVRPGDVSIDPVLEQVFVADAGNNRIQRFDRSGTFLGKWGSEGTADGQFGRPKSVEAASSGRIFVGDSGFNNSRVQVFTRTGSFIRKWGSRGSSDGQFAELEGIAVNTLGDVFVADALNADFSNNRVQKFDATGRFLGTWGSEGTADDEFGFVGPGDVAVDPLLGIPFVADTGNHQIKVFNRFGTFIRKWGSRGSGDGRFEFPGGIAVDGDGDVYVADTGNGRIQKFTAQGSFITKWGSEGSDRGQFSGPHGVAVDSDGNVYVAETGNDRIQKFSVVLPRTLITSEPPDPTSDATPTFRFTVDRRPLGASFRCSLDGAAFEPCSSPHTIAQPLRDGRHSFRVRGTDGDGHTAPTPAERSFTVDTAVPGTPSDPGPSTPADPEPGDHPPGAAKPSLPAQLEIRRATVRAARPAQRQLVVRGRLDEAAAGERVLIRFRAGGAQVRLRPVVRENGSFHVRRPLRGEHRRTRGGRLFVRFAGTDELRPARERLRASRRAVRLRLGQPRIRGSRVIVAGRVARRARKRVRIAVLFNRAGGEPGEISARAKVDRRGRFRKRLPVPPAVGDRGAWVSVTHPGRGPLHGQRIGSEAAP